MLASAAVDVIGQLDPLLRPLVLPHAPSDRSRLLEDLIEREARPIIRAVVHRELRGQEPAAARLTAEDLEADAVTQVLTRLTDLACRFDSEPVRDFAAYVAVTAFHQCHAAIRRLYPERSRLKNRLRYLLSHDARFATWESAGSRRLCGLRAWNGGHESPAASSRLRAIEDPTDALVQGVATSERRGPREPLLVLALLRHAAAPVELDELTGVVARILELREPHADAPMSERAAIEQIADPRASIVNELADREYLERLWDEVCQLPTRQRAALLLNLRDEQGRGVVVLLPRTGTAGIREIAAALEISATELAAMWGRLPLDDTQIAERLGATRQQVINLRKSARDRLGRRLRSIAGGR